MNEVISEQDIRIFVDAVGGYFSQISREQAEVRAAYLARGSERAPVHDFTGVVNLTGRYRGCVRFSAPRIMLRHLLMAMDEPNLVDENLLDAAGEIANTLAGNARRHFGESMEISVPVPLSGAAAADAPLRQRPYVIIIQWKGYAASLVVDIERADG